MNLQKITSGGKKCIQNGKMCEYYILQLRVMALISPIITKKLLAYVSVSFSVIIEKV